MMDRCTLYARTPGAVDEFNNPADVFTAGVSVICGYKSLATGETEQDTQALTIDGELRLPVGTALTAADRVMLTHRYGKAITPVLLDLVGMPVPGPSGIKVGVRRVLNG